MMKIRSALLVLVSLVMPIVKGATLEVTTIDRINLRVQPSFSDTIVITLEKEETGRITLKSGTIDRETHSPTDQIDDVVVREIEPSVFDEVTGLFFESDLLTKAQAWSSYPEELDGTWWSISVRSGGTFLGVSKWNPRDDEEFVQLGRRIMEVAEIEDPSPKS